MNVVLLSTYDLGRQPFGPAAPAPVRRLGHPSTKLCHSRRDQTSTYLHDFAYHTTVLRGFRLGARRAVMLEHHKRRATTSGGLARPPFGSLFPPPRGVGNA